MRIDVVTIFPDYLAPLDLSLIGQARAKGILDVHVHDLRDFTHDRHRTIDDTPYGGGAGMVMKPEPWSEALTAVREQGAVPAVREQGAGPAVREQGAGPAVDTPDAPPRRPRLLVPSPSGRPFTQALAADLATEPWLVFACGRYEGIDERVCAEAAETMDVTPVSLGDYVLNGGEVAVLAMVEAIGRLVPGVVGNPQSLVEESHQDGLLEYPVYTKPASWHGRDVPAVLLSGDHGAIAAWRHQQRLERTATRRPDLLHASQALTVPEVTIRPARGSDLGELFTLTRACWVQEAQANEALEIPPLMESFDDLRESLDGWQTWVAHASGRLVGSVRARAIPDDPTSWEIGRLMVSPDLQGRGLGRWLLEMAEGAAPREVTSFELITGANSLANIRRYRRSGYRPAPGGPEGTVRFVKVKD